MKSSVEDLSSQLEVMTEERDCSRMKEEELFEVNGRLEEDLMDTNNGYTYLTERLQEKEEEMEKLEDQVRMFQSAHENQSDRCSELQNELQQLRVEHRKLQGKLQEE